MNKVVYVGLHKENLFLLYGNFNVSAVAHIDAFDKNTFNPVNYIFKSVYFFRKYNRCRLLELFLLEIWMLTKRLSTSTFYSYGDYLEAISRNKTNIIDFCFPDKVETFIRNNEIDLLIVNTWEMLPRKIINAPKLGTVNVHPSKLPKYRGALPTLWALKNRDAESAITYILLDDSVDGGNIISQHTFGMTIEDNWFTIEEKATKVIKNTFVNMLTNYIEKCLMPYPQNKTELSFTDKYEHYRKICWDKEKAMDIFNKVNLYPFVEPDYFCFTYYRGKKVFIKKATIENLEWKSKNKFFINGFYLCVNAKGGVIKMKLFRDIDIIPSIYMFFQRSNLDLV